MQFTVIQEKIKIGSRIKALLRLGLIPKYFMNFEILHFLEFFVPVLDHPLRYSATNLKTTTAIRDTVGGTW